jgi:phytoene synthase
MRDAFAYCETLVSTGDKDRFLATLFAPAAQRAALHSLYAFNLEVARVREAARGPMAGEIRLQWWSDVLAGVGRGEVESSPVAAALLATVARYRLPVELLQALVDARRLDLYDEPPGTLADLERYAIDVSGGLFATAARVLGGGLPTDALARHAGVVHATAGLLEAFPVHAAAGRLFLPLDVLARAGTDRVRVLDRRDTTELRAATAELRQLAHRHVAEARRMMQSAPTDVVPALLPVAPALAILGRMERRGYDPLVPLKLPRWQRQWLIWRAARRPQRLFG